MYKCYCCCIRDVVRKFNLKNLNQHIEVNELFIEHKNIKKTYHKERKHKKNHTYIAILNRNPS